MRVLPGPTKSARAVAFSLDGTALAVSSDDGVIRLWNLATWTPTELGSFHRAPKVLVWIDGQRLGWSHADASGGSVCWTTTTGQTAELIPGPKVVGGVCLSPDGHTLFAATLDAILRWHVTDWAPRPPLPADLPVLLTVSPNGQSIASTHPLTPYLREYDYSIRVCDVTTGHEQLRLYGEPETWDGVAFAPDGTRLAAVGRRNLWLWEFPSGKEVCHHPSKKFYTGLAFSPDGRTLATTGNDGLVRLWDAVSGAPLKTFDWQINKTLCVAFAPDGTRAAVGGARGAVVVWDVD